MQAQSIPEHPPCVACDDPVTPRPEEYLLQFVYQLHPDGKPVWRQPLENRLWGRVVVTESGCWEFGGGTDRKGYGIIGVNGIAEKAHRAAWESFYGKIPDGMHCLHRCDNPGCIRPSHLFLGTPLDNVIDCRDKGRLKWLSGSQNPAAKLTDDSVRSIRELRARGTKQRVIADLFGVSRATIGDILTGRGWKHVA